MDIEDNASYNVLYFITNVTVALTCQIVMLFNFNVAVRL